MFHSPREAIAAHYAASKGPQLTQPRRDTSARGRSGRSVWDFVMVGAMLAVCGVEVGTDLEESVMRWALAQGQRTNEVRLVEIKMRALLREHGLMSARRRMPVKRLRTFGTHYPSRAHVELDHLVEDYAPAEDEGEAA